MCPSTFRSTAPSTVALTLATAVLASGCFASTHDGPVSETEESAVSDRGCGDLACSSGIYLSLAAQANTFDAGMYEVAVVIDGDPEYCEFSLATGETCGADPICVVDSRCDGPQIQFNFIILPHTIGLVVGPQGDVIEVDVDRDGRAILSQTIVPSYQDYAPNGIDCEPICRIAEATLPVP